ncbi:putative alpha/beta hydrolase [Rhodococcus sp. 27YEA15]|uniref:alpha/beta hydrolase family protein n=1 Tax=Rhodococcus sp. 27YEA15 TaxID=3156259 RepID=UPI003C7B8B0F
MTSDSPTKPPSEFILLEPVIVTTVDDAQFTLRVLPAAEPDAPVVLVLPAMVMKAKHYLPLAKALNRENLSVVTTDLRSQGESLPALREGKNFGYREMIESDLPSIIEAVQRRFPGARIHLFGHSLGGQLALLFAAAHTDTVASVTVIGTGTVYWRAFGPRRWLEALVDIQWIGLISRVKGYWPGGVLIPGAMAGGVMVDWSMHSLTSRYRPKGSDTPYDRLLARMTLPVLAISLEDDRLGPKSNVDFLTRRMPAAQVTRWHIGDDSPVIHRDHFEWLKDAAEIAVSVSAWIRSAVPPT